MFKIRDVWKNEDIEIAVSSKMSNVWSETDN
jgi:hypothetical protein